METVFKVGDVVYDNTITESKGKVMNIDLKSNYSITVNFDDIERCFNYTLDGRLVMDFHKTLSFTPYKLDICQERPIELPEVGEEIMVSDDEITWILDKFLRYEKIMDFPVTTYTGSYKHFKRLR